MKETSEKVEEFKARVRSKYPRQKEHSFKIPWYVLVVNMLLIVYILFVFSRREERESQGGTAILYRNIEYRLSFIKDRTTGESLAALSLRSQGPGRLTMRYREALGTLEFYQGKSRVAVEKIGGGVNMITLEPGETRTYTATVPVNDIRTFSQAPCAVMVPAKRSLVSLEARHLPLTARLIINTDDAVASIFDYRFYEVD